MENTRLGSRKSALGLLGLFGFLVSRPRAMQTKSPAWYPSESDGASMPHPCPHPRAKSPDVSSHAEAVLVCRSLGHRAASGSAGQECPLPNGEYFV
jgi:hypothetical protein